jgi:hypothetical protein
MADTLPEIIIDKIQLEKDKAKIRREKNKDQLKIYRDANKDRMKIYQEANKQKLIQYRIKNIDRRTAYYSEYRKNNKDKITVYQKAYNIAHKEEKAENYKCKKTIQDIKDSLAIIQT